MAQDNLRFDTFTEYWAKQLEDQGWLEHGYRLSKQETYGRIPGCQSTNHNQCYGELWQCAKCRKTVCYAEGTDNHPELCDDCWNQLYNSTLMPDKIADDGVNGYTIFVPCDCNKYGGGCGTWLEITPDGILALEDKDRLRISILLPQWLDEAIRQAVLE